MDVLLFVGTVNGQVHETVAVSPLIVIPRDNLVEIVVQMNASRRIDNGRSWIMHKVLRDQFFFRVSQHTLHGPFRRSLERRTHLLLRGWLFGPDGQIDHGDIGGWHANGHAREFSVELGNDLPDGLGGTRRGWNQIVDGATTGAPILAALAGTVDCQLRRRGRVDCCHERFDNSEFVVNDLGEWSQTVSGARSIGQDRFTIVFGVVDTHDKHGSVGGGGRDNDSGCTAFQMSFALFNRGENSRGFADCFGTGFAPRDICINNKN